MFNTLSSQKGIVHIIPLLVVVAIVAVAIWFLYPKDGLKVGKTSVEDRIASLQPKPFKDVSGDNKNYTAIKYLAREGVLEADGDGNFNPKDKLTRAEWAVMLVRLAGVKPDPNVYKNCYAGVGQGETEAAICYAKKQGWLEEFGNPSQSFLLVNIAFAQEESFNPDAVVKETEAVASLSKVLDGNVGDIFDATSSDLTNENAAGIIHQSLATIPFGNDTFTPEAANQLERYYVTELVDSLEAEEDFYSEFVKGQRDKNYQDLLEQDRASGIEAPTFNILEPLQNFVSVKAGQQPVSANDVLIYKRTPPEYESQLTSDPTINVRDSADIYIHLDENFRIMTKAQWGQTKPSYVLNMFFDHFYNNGQAVGSVIADLVNFETGVMEHHYSSPRSDFSRLNSMFNTAVNGIESLIGREIIPPAKSEPNDDKSESEPPSLADDDRPYPRLYFDVGKSDLPKYNNEICPSKLFYPDDKILVCGNSSSEPEDLINLVNQWRSGVIPGADGRYNTADGKQLTVTGEVFQACLAEVASQGITYLEQQECECRKRLGPHADVWMITGACERAAAGDSGESETPSSGYTTPDSPDTPWVEPR